MGWDNVPHEIIATASAAQARVSHTAFRAVPWNQWVKAENGGCFIWGFTFEAAQYEELLFSLILRCVIAVAYTFTNHRWLAVDCP